MIKCLIVDDEALIREMIKKYAIREGFLVYEASNGKEAMEVVQHHDIDVVIMDVMMEKCDGFEACQNIKKMNDIPIIMLSALGKEYDKVKAFDLGADDYVVKPFSPNELMKRIYAVVKRYRKLKDPSEVIVVGGLVIDLLARKVTVDEQDINLTQKEADLLFYLAKNQGIALTRPMLLQHVWGYDFFGDDRTLDTHMKIVRKKLGKYASCIVTLRGVGYRFEKTNET